MDTKSIYYNGNILTMDAFNRSVSAIVFEGDKVLATGDKAAMLALAGPDAERHDLQGKTAMPGFYDAHGHFMSFVKTLNFVDLNSPPIGGIRSIADSLAQLRKRASATPAGNWIIAYGYDDTMLEDKAFITRRQLDDVSTEHPIFVAHISGHLAMANTKALEHAGYTQATPNPEGGVIRREPDGTPNGVLEETALHPILFNLPKVSDDVFRAALRRASEHYLSKGITSATEAGMEVPLDALLSATDTGDLKVRLTFNPMYRGKNRKLRPMQSFGPMLRRSGSKIVQDGSLQGYTGYLSKPYHTPFNGDSGWCGYPIYSREELTELFMENRAQGIQVVVHANGDAATDDVIAAVEATQKAYPCCDPRYLLVHAQTVREDQLDRFLKLGITPSFFPSHAYYWGERHRELFLGPERTYRQNPMRSAITRGIVCTGHCDAPVVPNLPMLSIRSCVTRLSSKGNVMGKDQTITVMEALRAHTINGAYQNFEEHIKGSLEPGKYADMIILNANPLEHPHEKLHELQVLTTILGGNIVYSA